MRDAWFRDLRLLDHEGHDLGPFPDRQRKRSRKAAKPQRGKTARRTTTRWEDPACREVGLVPATAWVAFLGQAPKGRTRYCLKDHKKTQKAGNPCFRWRHRRLKVSWASCDSWFRDLRLLDHEGHDLGPFPDRQRRQSRKAAKPQRRKTARRTTTRGDDPACREVGLVPASAWVAFLGQAPKGRTRYRLKNHKKTQKGGNACFRWRHRRLKVSWASCDSWFRDLRLLDHEGHEGHELGHA